MKSHLVPSEADIYDHPTSISWLYRAVGGLHLAVVLSLLQARRSGTHYRSSFAVCPSVLATLDARLRRYYSRDISALSATEMLCIMLRYIISYILFYSILNGVHIFFTGDAGCARWHDVAGHAVFRHGCVASLCQQDLPPDRRQAPVIIAAQSGSSALQQTIRRPQRTTMWQDMIVFFEPSSETFYFPILILSTSLQHRLKRLKLHLFSLSYPGLLY